jgi:tol-pal system protein YbgF
MMTRILVRTATFIGLFLPGLLWAEAPVMDAVPASGISSSSSSNSTPNNYYSNTNDEGVPELPLSQDSNNNTSSYSTAPATSSNSTSLLSKVNDLQKEIQRLRGNLEVQEHELTKLKEQQQAYYNDLDQRINLLSSGNGKTTSTLSLNSAETQTTMEKTIIPVTQSGTQEVSSTQQEDEKSCYNAAYSLIEQKKFTEANTAMKGFIKQYPNGKYAANAHYWRGELLLAQHQDQAAIEEFNTVINDFSSSTKVSAAMLKLGFAYANLGDTEKAKATFTNIEQMFPETTIAQLAHARLESLN